MSDENFELSRRKVLAGLGTIGAASAGVGLGTSAYFSDEENFENNSLVAGSLDMKVDWEEHYSDWMGGEDEDPDSEGTLDIQMDVDDATGYTAFPPGVEAFDGVADDPYVNGDPLLYVHNDDVAQFMDNTAIDAFPDEDDDGVQDDFDEEMACEVLADVGADDAGLDPDGARTDSADTRLDNGDPAPLINLGDVKPGDFGEVTLSFHLCDNPGYVWLNAANVEARENGHTEPEAKDEDEEGPEDEVSTSVQNDVELLDAIQTAWWYDDNCDNLTQGEGTTAGNEADVMIVADGSGSVTGDSDKFQALQDGAEALVNAVGSNVRVGLTVFSTSATTVTTLADSKGDTISAIQNDGNYPGGGTDVGAGIDEGQAQLTTGAGARSGVDKIMVVLTNGISSTGRSEATSAKSAGTTIYGIAYGSGADQDLIEDISSPPKVDDSTIDDQDEFAFVADETDIGSVFTDIGETISTGEEIFFQGSLRTALTALTTDLGIPLDGDGGNDFDEIGAVLGDGDPTAEERGCFEPTPNTNCIGFSWWLPVDHANEIQSDSVMFDLGFYTEQCRHNDGSGIETGTETPQPE